MCKKLICLVLVLGLAAVVANADITSGLVGYYPFDEEAGDTAYDMLGNGHHGTLYNGVTWISQGFINGGINVDGTTNSRVEIGTWNPVEGTEQLSVALWMRWPGGGGGNQGLICKRDKWPNQMMFQLQLRPSLAPYLLVQSGGGGYDVQADEGVMTIRHWVLLTNLPGHPAQPVTHATPLLILAALQQRTSSSRLPVTGEVS